MTESINSTLAYCQKADRRYESETNAETECPYCRAEAAEARAADAERETKELHERTRIAEQRAEAAENLAIELDETTREKAQLEAERDEWADMFNIECAKVFDLRRNLNTTTDALNTANAQCAEMARKLEQAQEENSRLMRFLQTVVNIGDKDRHSAFDGERWREMRHCAIQAINTTKEMWEP